MQPGEALGIAAQVAVTLAGFAGIVVVFRPDSAKGRRIPPTDKRRVNRPLYYSIALLGTAALVLQVINVVAWNRFWPFFFLIFVSLGAAVAQFVRFLLLPHRR